MISVVITLFNDFKHGYIQEYIPSYKALSNEFDLEIIVIDGGSKDETHNFLEQNSISYFTLNNSTRLKRIQYGLQKAKGDKIIIQHPRSFLKRDAFEALQNTSAQWGGFTHVFDHNNPLLKFTSFYSNYIRFDLRNIIYLDHCIFIDQSLKDIILNLKDREIFEDTEISKALAKKYKPKRLLPVSQTSSVRFLTNGILRQIILNQRMKLAYYFKRDHKKMNVEYEKGLNLNNDN
jgi:glycosyltransferase involved in cell wall biosynthesis